MALRVIVITGATGGIGSATAWQFAKDGDIVVLVDHPSREKQLQDFSYELDVEMEAQAHVPWYTNDVTDAEDVARCVHLIVERFGRIDVLVNTAGILPRLGPLVKTDIAEARRIMDVNFFGTMHWCKEALLLMRTRGYGKIVNVASVVAVKGDAGNLVYAASKAAVASLTKTLAIEASYNKSGLPLNITVNAVAPGITDTPMVAVLPAASLQKELGRIPFQRKGKPNEVAEAIHFLASDKASFVNGEILFVDGGYSVT